MWAWRRLTALLSIVTLLWLPSSADGEDTVADLGGATPSPHPVRLTYPTADPTYPKHVGPMPTTSPTTPRETAPTTSPSSSLINNPTTSPTPPETAEPTVSPTRSPSEVPPTSNSPEPTEAPTAENPGGGSGTTTQNRKLAANARHALIGLGLGVLLLSIIALMWFGWDNKKRKAALKLKKAEERAARKKERSPSPSPSGSGQERTTKGGGSHTRGKRRRGAQEPRGPPHQIKFKAMDSGSKKSLVSIGWIGSPLPNSNPRLGFDDTSVSFVSRKSTDSNVILVPLPRDTKSSKTKSFTKTDSTASFGSRDSSLRDSTRQISLPVRMTPKMAQRMREKEKFRSGEKYARQGTNPALPEEGSLSVNSDDEMPLSGRGATAI